ncbi:circadian clock protein KaiC [Archaeoglobales archaeon]|nr:MAG: circadian clock protein KaiC [Archaeoglobales archaeon]
MIEPQRIKTGILGLDEILGGGFVPNTVNVILGSAGAGKTIFSIQYLLKGVEEGNKCIFVSFDMDERDLLRTTKSLGWNEVEDYISEGKLSVNKFFAENVSYVNNDLLNLLMSESNTKTRIVIDSFTPMISSLNFESRNDVNWFFNKLREIGTAVITIEEPLNGNLGAASVSLPLFLGDCVIHLKNIGYGEAFSRTLRVIKHRSSWHAEGVFPYKILDGIGIYVEGIDYLKEVKEGIDVNEILEELGIARKDIDPKVMERVERVATSASESARKAIIDLLRTQFK